MIEACFKSECSDGWTGGLADANENDVLALTVASSSPSCFIPARARGRPLIRVNVRHISPVPGINNQHLLVLYCQSHETKEGWVSPTLTLVKRSKDAALPNAYTASV